MTRTLRQHVGTLRALCTDTAFVRGVATTRAAEVTPEVVRYCCGVTTGLDWQL